MRCKPVGSESQATNPYDVLGLVFDQSFPVRPLWTWLPHRSLNLDIATLHHVVGQTNMFESLHFLIANQYFLGLICKEFRVRGKVAAVTSLPHFVQWSPVRGGLLTGISSAFRIVGESPHPSSVLR